MPERSSRFLPCAGNLNTNGQELLVYGRHFGNVFIGVQVTTLCGLA